MTRYECRLGNIVQTVEDKVPCKVTCLGEGTFRVDIYNGWNNSVEAFEGIPITPEILSKCGFRKGEQWYIHQVYYNGTIDINTNRHGIHYGKKTEHGFDSIIELTSLHQLQNLFFALTGKELKYKP